MLSEIISSLDELALPCEIDPRVLARVRVIRTSSPFFSPSISIFAGQLVLSQLVFSAASIEKLEVDLVLLFTFIF